MKARGGGPLQSARLHSSGTTWLRFLDRNQRRRRRRFAQRGLYKVCLSKRYSPMEPLLSGAAMRFMLPTWSPSFLMVSWLSLRKFCSRKSQNYRQTERGCAVRRAFQTAFLVRFASFLSYLRWGHYGCRPGGGRPEYKCSLPSGSPARKTWHPSRLSNPPALVSAARHACMNVTGLTSRQKMETYSDSLQQNATPSHVLILQQLLGVFLFLLRERQEKTGKFLQGNVGPVKVHAL